MIDEALPKPVLCYESIEAASPKADRHYEPHCASEPDDLPMYQVLAKHLRAALKPTWDTASIVCAGFTALFSAACVIGMFNTNDMDTAIVLFALGFIGNWMGGGLGLLCALIGYFRPNDDCRGRLLGGLLSNAAVVGVPPLVVAGCLA